METMRGRTLLASGFQAPSRNVIDCLDDVLIDVDTSGTITELIRPGDSGYPGALSDARRSGRLMELPEGSYLLPGLLDLHVHAPQYPQLGLALDAPLEVWLNRYTFPLESRYADAGFALESYRTLVDDLIANGTTTVAYFATIHEEATRILVDTCLSKGQRAVIGKVAMDNPGECPDYYRDESATESVEASRRIIDYIQSHPENRDALVSPAVVPRFIPSCSDESLEKLGKLATDTGSYVLTHCSESDWEHEYVKDRHGRTDASSLDRFKLLGRRSILAHSVFLEDEDMALVRKRESAVAHCPLSNSYFADAVFPLKEALEKGLHVGLGTDISGGPNASLFAEMRAAIQVSRILESGSNPAVPRRQRGRNGSWRIDVRDAFYLATNGGGIALEQPVGLFAPGYRFDAIVVDTRTGEGTIRTWPERDSGEEILQKIIYTASRPNITAVWIDGRNVA